jgi:protease-4
MSDNDPKKTEPRRPKKKVNKSGLSIFIIIIAVALIVSVKASIESFRIPISKITNAAQNSSGTAATDTVTKEIKNTIVRKFNPGAYSYVAVLHIEGVIQDANKTYNQEWLLTTIGNLKEDAENKAIVLYINSPGGAVYQADEIYTALQDYKATGKPVLAYMGPLAASGGYYIACAADKISANRNTLTGSIGVIAGQSVDLTGLMEKAGIKATTITAGKNKNMMNYNAPLTPEQRNIMQTVADECYRQFVEIVADSRKMKYDDVGKLADGRIYTARQALNKGLIDSICSWNEEISKIEKDYFNNQHIDIIQYEYQEKNSLLDLLTSTLSSVAALKTKNSVPVPEMLLSIVKPDIPYPAYYCEIQ